MMPTIESMKTIGMPASVRATKITPSATSSDAPISSSPAAAPQTTAPIARPPAPATNAARSPWRPWAASRVAPAASADR